MNFSALKSDKKSPILIVDKIGAIGQELARALSPDFLIVLLSPNPIEGNAQIIHIPFKKRIPQAPSGNYSKIFVVDDGHSVTRESAFSFIEKARDTNCPFFFIGSIRNVDVKHSDQVASSYSNSKILIFGDLFDGNIIFDRQSSVNEFILQARKTGKIEVEGNGLSLSFPITFTDTIKLIIKASYLEIAQKIILLFYPHPITDISLANTFKKINPDIKVDFVKEKKEKEIYIPHGAQHAISKYDLESKIRNLSLEDLETSKQKIIKKDNGHRSFLKPFIMLFLIFVFILLLPLLTTSAYVALGQREISGASISANEGEFDKARKQINNSKTFFGLALKTSDPLIWEAKILSVGDIAGRIRNKAQEGATISFALSYLFDGVYLLKDIYSGKSKDPKIDFSKASNFFKSGASLIQKTKAENSLPKDISEDLDNITPFIDLLSNSENILSDMLGFEKEKNYLVLFQDEANLRPGGGYIRSIGILKVRNAKITKFNTLDSASIDEKLDTQIDSPFMLRRYLSLKSLNLSNSNTEADFINSAISASNIYLLAKDDLPSDMQGKVDAVIALDLHFIKNILSEMGTITVSGKKITEENLFEYQNQTSLEDGDFISLAAKALKEDLGKRKSIPYFGLGREVGKSILQKDLLFASPIPSYQNMLTANGWSSSLWDNRNKENNIVNDYLGIVETNMNSNSNYFISRSVSKKITLSETGKLTSTLTIRFKNNSKKKDEGSYYKNYLQLILPESSKISSIQIDKEKVKIEEAVTDPKIYESSNFKPPLGLEVDEINKMGKSIFGFLLMVPEESIKTVTISYDLPYSISPSQKFFSYSLKIYKQPGITSYPLDLNFDLPDNFRILEEENSFSWDVKEDQDYQFTIAKK